MGYNTLEASPVAGGAGGPCGMAEPTVPKLLGADMPEAGGLSLAGSVPEDKEPSDEELDAAENEAESAHPITADEVNRWKANGIHGLSAAQNFGAAMSHRLGMRNFSTTFQRPPGGPQPSGLGDWDDVHAHRAPAPTRRLRAGTSAAGAARP